MAFLTIEDLVGTVEVLVFPQSFNTYRSVIDTSDKVFVTGRVSANADENGKLICEKLSALTVCRRSSGFVLPIWQNIRKSRRN